MKIKHPIFNSKNRYGRDQWYAIINGSFYYWGVLTSRWEKSMNEPGKNERELQAAMDEGRVYMVQLRGAIS